MLGVLSLVNHKGFILGLKKTFIRRHIVDRANKAEIKPEEQSEKTESCWENLWNKMQLKVEQTQKTGAKQDNTNKNITFEEHHPKYFFFF